ncbi:TIGR00282 family metallophosphoesterase [Commensalibacter oyaizuii]|uniref:TIGR00282 family metallophosphoesterase n=1 Tax=Commensalibacter oyaizuii TaxID=3043873 RepID=A0ABT6PYL2_9PROT|nr:TIGR00282 family metallophosphoesterase [Commensalibacter sp. TBRC 16381]MDI2089904.1 TIGR00282 family metallophosphoesterase [Commensalibacter sp. TBRC 16381]
MRIVFLGDIVGRSGREVIFKELPVLKQQLRIDGVVVNGENASHGFGLSPAIATDLFKSGVDVITLGNHSWDRKDLIPFIQNEPRIIRPLNYPPKTPGLGYYITTLRANRKMLVINAMGRLFMEPLDDPFRMIDELLSRYRLGKEVHMILVDIHAEATSEKTALAHYLDGRVSVVVGTHTHVPTADYRILPSGTAFQTDAGMCGDYNSVIGMQKDAAIYRFITKMPGIRFAPAEGQATLCGLVVQIDDATGHAQRVAPIRIGGELDSVVPDWGPER